MSLDTSRDVDPTASTAPGAVQALSTQPAPVGAPGAGGLLRTLRRGWRQLTSMRTALLLLVLLALAAVPGSILPQRATEPAAVDSYYIKHPSLAPFLNRLSLFDVFHAPWFAAVYALLFVSLIGCLVPRIKLHIRALRRRPPSAPARLDRLPQSAHWETDLPAATAVAAAARALRGKRFRVSVDGATVSAEKGYMRETGNLIFHVALVLLLIGIGVGSMFGYQGSVLLQDGHSFTNIEALYDTYKPGVFTSNSDLSPFTVALKSFQATYQTDGTAKSFSADVLSTTAAGKTTEHNVRVNHPLTFGHTRVYLIGHGYSVHVVLRDAKGVVWFDDTVPCIPQDLVNYLSQCVIKAPDTGAMVPETITNPDGGQTAIVDEPLEFGFLMNFVPTAEISPISGIISTYPAPTRPRVVIAAFTGDLGVDTGLPVSVYNLDTSTLNPVKIPVADAVVTPGDGTKVPLTDGFTVQVTGYSQWASLQVKNDPAKLGTLIAAGLIVLGLLLSLRVRRRRVWLRATDAAGGRTLLQVGGLARTDADDFAREFPGLVGRMARAAPPPGFAQPDRPTHDSPPALPGTAPTDPEETPGAR